VKEWLALLPEKERASFNRMIGLRGNDVHPGIYLAKARPRW